MTDLPGDDLPVKRTDATPEAGAPRTPAIEQQPIVIRVKPDISDTTDAADGDWLHVRDDEEPDEHWDSDRGEMVKLPAKPASGKAPVEAAVRVALEALRKQI